MIDHEKMARDKSDNIIEDGPVVLDGEPVGIESDEKRGTADDRDNMFRLGKVQELRVG